ncbi:glycosyltransferase [Cellulomonas sp. McL0617]|uniref:glycosyltransferase n=1 Tax=Cellulomonas sp. McL0617 TaxID=3415675 RepID=UPI003CF89C96
MVPRLSTDGHATDRSTSVSDGAPGRPELMRAHPPDRAARALHGTGYAALTVLTGLVDVLPARIRFGHARTLTQRALGLHDIPRIPATTSAVQVTERAAVGEPERAQSVACALVTETLDIGGVEAVVGILARELPQRGIACRVITLHGGRQAEALRRAGVSVTVVDGAAGLSAALAENRPDVVQVHTATPPMIDALLASGLPLVPVVHNVELYRSPLAWAATARLSHAATVTIAVSDAVRRDHLEHVGEPGPGAVTLVPNGAPRSVVESAPSRSVARSQLTEILGVDVRDDVVVVSLARYDIQKNAAGLVDAFLQAATLDRRLRLVIAGEPSDWLEYRRADELRLSHALGHRVNLLGDSDAGTLLAAADIFALNSYFEGWPVSATEARTLGLPVVMSDVGGARELVGTDGVGGAVAPNPSGSTLTRRSVARARRRLHQPSRTAFANALATIAATERLAAARRVPADSRDQMIGSHAGILRRVVDTQVSR